MSVHALCDYICRFSSGPASPFLETDPVVYSFQSEKNTVSRSSNQRVESVSSQQSKFQDLNNDTENMSFNHMSNYTGIENKTGFWDGMAVLIIN